MALSEEREKYYLKSIGQFKEFLSREHKAEFYTKPIHLAPGIFTNEAWIIYLINLYQKELRQIDVNTELEISVKAKLASSKMSETALREVLIIGWRARARDWRNNQDPEYRTEIVLQYAHECELIADALEAGQKSPNLLGY